MAVRIVKLGSDRYDQEGPRLGTVRRPPRGVPKTEFSNRNYYDCWLPILAPSQDLMSFGKSAISDVSWMEFTKRYQSELMASGGDRVLDMLAMLSHTAHFSMGCYCDDESRCHRWILKRLLLEKGALVL